MIDEQRRGPATELTASQIAFFINLEGHIHRVEIGEAPDIEQNIIATHDSKQIKFRLKCVERIDLLLNLKRSNFAGSALHRATDCRIKEKRYCKFCRRRQQEHDKRRNKRELNQHAATSDSQYVAEAADYQKLFCQHASSQSIF